MKVWLAWAIASAILVAASPALAHAMPGAPPSFDPLRFFAGRTRSSGMLADGFGCPAGRFVGTTEGHRSSDGATAFDQMIRMDDGSIRRRSFRLVRTGPGAIDVTGSEVVGTAHGIVEGGTLHLVSTIQLSAGNPLSDVRFDQIFTLLPNGRSLANHSDISVLGIVVRRADEVFTRIGSAR